MSELSDELKGILKDHLRIEVDVEGSPGYGSRKIRVTVKFDDTVICEDSDHIPKIT